MAINADHLPIKDQLLISLAAHDLEEARRLMPEHRIFTGPEPDLNVTMVGGNCPALAEGTAAGVPFWFRARGGSWALRFGDVPVFRPEFEMTGEDQSGGFMDESEVMELLMAGARIVTVLTEDSPELPGPEG